MSSLLMLIGGSGLVFLLGIDGYNQIVNGYSLIVETSELLIKSFATIVLLLPVISKLIAWFRDLLFIFPSDISLITNGFLALWIAIWTWKLVKS